MKRSQINAAILKAMEILEAQKLSLPPFAYWRREDWQAHKGELDNLIKIGLGWDVTDFGSGEFSRVGGVLFTIRNGCLEDRNAGTPYAEKLIVLCHEAGQALPMHFHRMKTEDIIHRGGGTLVMRLYGSTPDGRLDETHEITLKEDGIFRTIRPGEIIEIEKGSSVTLTPGIYHSFWAKEGQGDLVVGEVSSVNDDTSDNIFLERNNRFSAIEEDEPPLFFLCNEYQNRLF